MMHTECCNICAGNRFKQLFEETAEGSTFGVCQCVDCGLVFTHPQPSAMLLNKLYGLESYRENTVSGAYCTNADVSGMDFPIVLRRLSRQIAVQHRPRLLDLGCGTGAFLVAAKEHGMDICGCEPSSYASPIARERLGECVFQGVLSDAHYAEESFDAITIWYVLEHVTDPRAILDHVRKLLRPRGVLFVSVPNWNYIRLRRWFAFPFGGRMGSVHAHEHLFQFSPKTLDRLLQECGFTSVESWPATPYCIGSSIQNAFKKLLFLPVRILHSLCGINYGGILGLYRKT